MQYYVSQRNHCKNLKKLVEFIVKIYLPSWFEIKANNRLSNGSQNLFNMIQRINSFSNIKICKLCYKVLNNNSYFAHGENILVAMLNDKDQLVRRKAIEIMLTLSGNPGSFPHENILDHAGNEDIVGDTLDIDDDTESVGDKSSKNASKYPPMDPTVRLFKKPTINFEASATTIWFIFLIGKVFYQCKVKAVMISFDDWRKVHLNLIMNAIDRMLRDILNWLQKPPVLSVAI